MERYNKITTKICREIVLLKAYPCAWGKCSFCDYIDDNSTQLEAMTTLNEQVLSQITGEYSVLEVINSGSCFELPQATLELLRDIIQAKKIRRLFLESHWMYRKKLQDMRDFMGIPITFKIGVETFDYHFRQEILNKNASFKTPEEVRSYFDSPCLMVGIQGQTKEMIDRDMHIIRNYFNHATINIYTNNTTAVKRDDLLVKWFIEKYNDLLLDPAIDILYNNTDFGVGD